MHKLSSVHVPVMLREVLEIFTMAKPRYMIDATFGGGGHTRALLEHLPQVHLTVIDRDPEAIERAQLLAQEERYRGRLHVVHAAFGSLSSVLNEQRESPGGVLFDLGVSSDQLAQAQRGFSFRLCGPLDMRMDPRQELSAYQVVNYSSQSHLARLLLHEGEEVHAERIAQAIVQTRRNAPISTTTQLAELISKVVPMANSKRNAIFTHPATRSFQALRIKVNEELEQLKSGLHAAFNLLAPGGVLAVISFQALEDRLVKEYFTTLNHASHVETIIKGHLSPSQQELQSNQRCRSAKLRAVRKKEQKQAIN